TRRAGLPSPPCGRPRALPWPRSCCWARDIGRLSCSAVGFYTPTEEGGIRTGTKGPPPAIRRLDSTPRARVETKSSLLVQEPELRVAAVEIDAFIEILVVIRHEDPRTSGRA